MNFIKDWFAKGTPWIWLNAGAIAISVVAVLGLLALIAVRGLGHFWPNDVMQISYTDFDNKSSILVGELQDDEEVIATRIRATGVEVPEGQEYVSRWLLKTGNRDSAGLDFRWIYADRINSIDYPEELFVLERREWGNFYGRVVAIKESGKIITEDQENISKELHQRLDRALQLHEKITGIEKHEIGGINYKIEQLRLKTRKLELTGLDTPQALAEIAAKEQELKEQYEVLSKELTQYYQQIQRDSLLATIADGTQVEIEFKKIVKAHQPNAMTRLNKIVDYFRNLSNFLSEDPREANTEGGIFPAIFGTILMVMLMSVIVTPFGVVAAVYLREYAKQGFMTRLARVAVNNLAGVPSIVYGVFGLGFFIYFLGGELDSLFYPEAAPAPVFGTPGLMWASITLALLTVPVVIVATEEGLTRIPKSIREGSLALGATKFETLWKIILPMSSPAMMTGLILAIARAAGEVAPLMLVGVVKLAPTLPVDLNAPFLHLERKFMHLGFHIYDVGFQSPNVEAARPLVYATAFLLVAVIAVLNLTAVLIRNRLREKYKSLET